MFRWLIAVCLVLAGCATPAQRAAQMEAEVARMIQEYGPACEKLGFARDSDKWRDCILRLSYKVEQRYTGYTVYPTACYTGHAGFYDCMPY